ncbi:hypothetical protein AGABI1DRAFT_59499 [Agaricus bisporus var. burnettii JB137-S8]|uniref:Aerobactin siderophore biosynthesis IucA/IucC N-terminal domain-containing protein n=2 Tax=Agaricus bisporus var. burnettii TaxID=192524 RepID=K5X612_AGABU|nr:uncharacterized protein AGABI1DRAFT_59499 [Agaricus bisporus var. burnettii JB137-S8]EKM78593.1 hypothetical protein AGABI1DRAFT_59499 [Agaricus bisporus var. burnettii JB137-S8]KAF7773335.1 hypothetical protein Agabi119p4_5502 [Agaricus bisporus var. burnettii]
MSSGYYLPPVQHASFAVISRLISCLVTESLLRAYYIPLSGVPDTSGFAVILSTHLVSEKPVLERSLRPHDIFAIVPLLHTPVLKEDTVSRHGYPIGLLDPLDMAPVFYELADKPITGTNNNHLKRGVIDSLLPNPWELGNFRELIEITDPVYIWRKFVDGIIIQESLSENIEKELLSSYEWQKLAFEGPPALPSLSSAPIKFEQSLVAGHPTHPMHRARTFDSATLEYDWYQPRIRFVGVPRSSIQILGDFDNLSRNLAELAASRAGQALPNDDSLIFMPVHEMQIGNIKKRFNDVEVLPSEVFLPALGQSSIRTVILPDLPGKTLKLAVGVKISSSLRTISHFTADFGPRFSSEIIPKLAVDREILHIETETESAIYRDQDPDKAKHFTVVVRNAYEPKEGETVIVVAALLEMGHGNVPAGVSAVEHLFGLHTQEKRIAFLDRYIEVACRALLPALLQNGVAFEAHAQNVVARFDTATGRLLGFIYRDLGGLRIDFKKLRESTGVDFEFLPGHCVLSDSIQEASTKFYHTFVHNHIQRLIRLLKLHSNGIGWEILRKHMNAVIPRDHKLWDLWMNPERKKVESKCLMRMRMRDSYRDTVYSPYVNMVQYHPRAIYGDEKSPLN